MIKEDNSKRLERPFLEEKKGWLKKEPEKVEELKEFVLVLMKNNGHSDFIEGVQAGEFYMKSADGKQEKSILLTPNKLTTFNYNGQYFKGWIAHEDNMSPYPQDPVHNGEMFRKTTQKIAMNYRDANEAKYLEARTKMWLYIIGGIILGLYVLYIIAKNAGWLAGGDDVTATQVAGQVVQNMSDLANSTGVRVG